MHACSPVFNLPVHRSVYSTLATKKKKKNLRHGLGDGECGEKSLRCPPKATSLQVYRSTSGQVNKRPMSLANAQGKHPARTQLDLHVRAGTVRSTHTHKQAVPLQDYRHCKTYQCSEMVGLMQPKDQWQGDFCPFCIACAIPSIITEMPIML